MRIDILTLFPEMFVPLTESIIGRAVKDGKVQINVINIRDYTTDKHGKCDDYPFGGGAGMLMMAQPIVAAFSATDPEHKAYRVYMSPKGRRFEQKHIKKLLAHEHLIFLCGHYEGVDQRALDGFVDDEISIGDYVLTGGELPALVVINTVARYIDGVLGSDESTSEESFSNGLLEYPQYTRPEVYRGRSVPEVLLGGNHKDIAKWREEKSLEITMKNRPDLFKDADLKAYLPKKKKKHRR